MGAQVQKEGRSKKSFYMTEFCWIHLFYQVYQYWVSHLVDTLQRRFRNTISLPWEDLEVCARGGGVTGGRNLPGKSQLTIGFLRNTGLDLPHPQPPSTEFSGSAQIGNASAKSAKLRGIRPRPYMRIYFDNAGDSVTLTLNNVTLTSQKPC